MLTIAPISQIICGKYVSSSILTFGAHSSPSTKQAITERSTINVFLSGGFLMENLQCPNTNISVGLLISYTYIEQLMIHNNVKQSNMKYLIN